MKTTLPIAAIALISLTISAPAFAGMPDAYRVAPPPTPHARASESAAPYALTGQRQYQDVAKAPARWQQHLERVGNKPEPRIRFTR
jgi:hypothetical protein